MTPSKGILNRKWPDRFWDKVNKTDACWLWQGTLTRARSRGAEGYGQVRLNDRITVAHRVAYELLVGPIPKGTQLDHLCRVRTCVNPAHLEPVTPKENYLRGASPMAQNARKTHCNRGHALSGQNVYLANGGRSRRCRSCKLLNERARRARELIES